MPLIHYNHCPVCNSENIVPALDVKDYTVSHQNFTVFQCNDCTLRFTQDVPDEASIGEYYKSEDYISHTNTTQGFINKLYQNVRNKTMRQKAAIVQKQTSLSSGCLLDVGCGTGTFLHTMQQAGWNVTGLEPNTDARKKANELYNLYPLPSSELFSLTEQSFDVITMWHVLEHVHQLHSYIEQLKKLLKPNGKIIIAVPNYLSSDAQYYQQFWAAYDVPRHLYHFSPKAMNTLLAQHQLKVTKLLPMWYDSFYIAMLSSKYKNGYTNYVFAFRQGLLSNMHAKNNIDKCCSVIYIIKQSV